MHVTGKVCDDAPPYLLPPSSPFVGEEGAKVRWGIIAHLTRHVHHQTLLYREEGAAAVGTERWPTLTQWLHMHGTSLSL